MPPAKNRNHDDANGKEKSTGHTSTKMRRGASQQSHMTAPPPTSAPAPVKEPEQPPPTVCHFACRASQPTRELTFLCADSMVFSRSKRSTQISSTLPLIDSRFLLRLVPSNGVVATSRHRTLLPHDDPKETSKTTSQRSSCDGSEETLQWRRDPGE